MESQIFTIIETKSPFTEMDLDWGRPFPIFYLIYFALIFLGRATIPYEIFPDTMKKLDK